MQKKKLTRRVFCHHQVLTTLKSFFQELIGWLVLQHLITFTAEVKIHGCMKIISFSAFRTTTSALLPWTGTPPSCWLCWGYGTSISSMLRITPCCPMTSTCTGLLHTSNRSAPAFHTLDPIFQNIWMNRNNSFVYRVTWSRMESTLPSREPV